MKNKNIAILGGTGFIGKNFIELFQTDFNKILCISGDQERFKNCSFGQNVSYVSNALGKEKLIAEMINHEIRYILDLSYATVPKTSFDDPLNDISSNLFGTVNTFEWVKQVNIEKLIWFSTGGAIYGQTDKLLIDETFPVNPISPYGITKLALEKYGYMYYKLSNLPIICLRPSNAFGPYQLPFRGQGFIATAIVSILNGKPIHLFGANGTVRDYLYVEDLCQAINDAFIKAEPGEVYNVSTGKGINNFEILNRLTELASMIGKKAEIIIEESRPFDVSYNVLDYSKFHSQTGWSPKIEFNVALKKTWDWYCKNYISEK
jgi:UDP-glucose 4-epimerase